MQVIERARVAVVVPAFNEEERIAETIRSVPSWVDAVIVVDDASRDATSEAARRVGGTRVEVIRHAENRGVGAAIVTGYRRALEIGADVAAVMAGDGQMDPEDLPRLVLPVIRGDVDYVKGNRLRHPGVWGSMPKVRLAGTAMLAWLTKAASGVPELGDSQCGYTAISARAIEAIDLDSLWPRYGYPNDLIGALAFEGMRIGEVVVAPVYRGEKSGLRPWHAATIGYVVGRLAWRRGARWLVGLVGLVRLVRAEPRSPRGEAGVAISS